MKSPAIILAFITVVSIFTFSEAEFASMKNESSQVESTTPAINNSAPSSPSNYSMMDTALYLQAVMNAINHYENISIHPQHPVIPGGNQKKAAYAQVNNTEVTNFRELVRFVINSRAAPAIKTVLSNLDRDLFKLFTSDTPVTTTGAATNVIFQHEYPTEEPSTSAAPSTTTKDGIRNLVDGEDDDDDDESNDEVGKVGKLSSASSSYKISMRVKKTTPKPTIVQEDDEDESVVFDKLKDLKKHA